LSINFHGTREEGEKGGGEGRRPRARQPQCVTWPRSRLRAKEHVSSDAEKWPRIEVRKGRGGKGIGGRMREATELGAAAIIPIAASAPSAASQSGARNAGKKKRKRGEEHRRARNRLHGRMCLTTPGTDPYALDANGTQPLERGKKGGKGGRGKPGAD